MLSLMTNGVQAPGPTAAVAAIERSGSTSASTSTAVEEGADMIKEEEGEGDDSEVEGVANSFGVLKVDAETEKTMYIGDSHWHMVLSDVSLSQNANRLAWRKQSVCVEGILPGMG